MGSSATSPSPATPRDFFAVFRTEAGAAGTLTFARFMELALYHPEVGYYRRTGPRVGYGAGTDFFTASTSGPVFGKLVTAACVHLLKGRNPRDYTFVEIGSESKEGVLAGVAHPFGAVRTVRVGAPLELAGRCVVFSNELFDAQVFHRYVFRPHGWQELGVAVRNEALAEVDLPVATPAVLPATASEGHVFDAPLGATALAGQIAAQPWQGLFIACDYGMTFRELSENRPAGTARAYYRHTQSNDLLARPGEQDLTCHVCWDWLAEALTKRGFALPMVESQEAFFVKYAGDFIAGLATAGAAGFSREKLSLLQLLHPSHLGQKFQVLHAFREENRG